MVRSTTSITIDRAVLEWIRRRIKEGVFASRSHAIDYALRRLMRESRAGPSPPFHQSNR